MCLGIWHPYSGQHSIGLEGGKVRDRCSARPAVQHFFYSHFASRT